MIQSSTFYGVIVGIYTTLALISATVALSIWKRAGEKINTSDISSIIEEQNKEFDETTAKFVKPILQNLLVMTDGGIERGDDIEHELEDSVREADISLQDLKNLIEAYKDTQRPRKLHDARRRHYKVSYGCFAFVSLGSVGSAFTMAVMAYQGLRFTLWPPDGWDIPILTIGAFMSALLYIGISRFKKANKIDHRLEDLSI